MDKTVKVIKGVSSLFSIKQLTLYILLAICSLNLQAQATYPVQVYTQLTSPYTPYLPAYYSGINQKLKVTLINTDMQQSTLSVYLRMKIKSSSFTIETTENVYTQQIELQAGVPMQLSLNDLTVYFKNENMRISGARNEFLRTQMLPDNFYRFNFEVYEANTNRLVSNPNLGFAQAMIASGEPPILNLPFKGTAIQESNIPSIMFSWTPRHMNSVASAYGTEYEITLVEIYDKQVAPEAAFDYSRPIYTETTRATSFIYTSAQPMLIPGMRYAWRVQAVAREGIEEANVFKNNGYSPISWFDYTVQCDLVQSTGVVVEGRVANVTWTATDAIDYDVQYRKKGSSKWYAGGIVNGACPIYNLKFGQEYEYKVGVRCTMNDAFIYTDVKGFKMPEELAKNANCGILPNINISNQTPTRELQAKLPILVGDFPVFITKVSGSGTFSGEGYVGIPYLNNAKIAVTFKDIVVNTDNRMIAGFFETKYDISNNNLLWDADETLTGGKGVGDIRTGEEKAQYQVDYTIDSGLTKVPVKVDTSKDEIKEGEDSQFAKGENERYVVTLKDSEGKEHNVVVDKFPATIQDNSGATYEVDKEGNIKQVSSKSDIALDSKTKYIQDTIATVAFEEIKDKTKYALDIYNDIYKKVAEFEREYVVEEGQKIRASAKFMIPNSSDEIFVRLAKSGAGFDPKNVRFVTENQKEYKATYDETKKGWTLTLVASEAKDGQLLYVVYDKGDKKYGTLAVLKILTYEPIERFVNIVPVNGFDNGFVQAQVEDELNKIYGKVGVTWHVNVVDNFEYAPLVNKGLQVTGSGLFATLTNDMKALNNAYTSALGESYRESDLYLFVIKSSDGGETPEGDMPRGKQFGYLFEGATPQTIAHELGHGAFNLEHPFSRAGRNSFDEGALKENLMDYRNGTQFSKLEWDAIYAPGLVIGLFQKDKDGMFAGKFALTPNYKVIKVAKSNTIYTKYAKEKKGLIGTLPAFIVEEDGIAKGYVWNGEAYENDKDNQDIYDVTYISSPHKKDKIYLLYNLQESCGGYRITVEYGEIANAIKGSNVEADLEKIINSLSVSKKQIPCVQLGSTESGKNEEWTTSDLLQQEDERICELMYNGVDLFDIPNIITTAPGKTLGEVRVSHLKGLISSNKDFNGTEDLETLDIGNPHYIHYGSKYNVFSDDNVILDELNMKLAYLQASTGLKFYTTFYGLRCTPTIGNVESTAQKLLEKLDLGGKGIICVIAENKQMNGADSDNVTVGLAFGADVPIEIQDIIKNNIGGSYKIKDFSFSKKLISTYKAIPKRKITYHYLISKITDEENRDYLQRKHAYYINDATFLDPLTSTIKVVKEIPSEETDGLALEVMYHIHDTKIDKYTTVDLGKYELKEKYVISDGVGSDIQKIGEEIRTSSSDSRWSSSVGLMVARDIAEKEAGWQLTSHSTMGNGETRTNRPATTTYYNYYYSGYPSSSREIIDDIFLYASLIPSTRTFYVVAGMAIVYYTANDEPDKALGYLVGFGLVKSAPVIAELIVTSKAANYYRLWKSARAVIKEIDNQVVNFDRAALDAYLNSEKTIEYIAKNNISGNGGNHWILLNESEVLVGKLVEKGDDLVLQTQYLAKYNDNAISQAVQKGSNLTDDQINNLIRTAEKNVAGGKGIDDLFPLLKGETDFQSFKNLCQSNPKVTVELADANWNAFVAETKKAYGIGSKRNIARIEFEGHQKIIASGEGYNTQMANSNNFISEEIITQIKKGERVFEPTISTRHLDTESIGLEYFAKQHNAIKGGKYPNIKGELKVTSDLCPCPSCSAIFQQFSEMFPNVNIKIVTTAKLHY